MPASHVTFVRFLLVGLYAVSCGLDALMSAEEEARAAHPEIVERLAAARRKGKDDG